MKKPLHTHNYNTMSNRFLTGRVRGIGFSSLFATALVFVMSLSAYAQMMVNPDIGVATKVLNVDNPSSGTLGNFNIVYEIRVRNTGDVALSSIQVSNALPAGSFLDGSLVRVTEKPFVSQQPAGAFHLGNTNYNATSDLDLLVGNSGLAPGDEFTIQVAYEVNSDDITGNAPHQVIATGTYNAVNFSDLSDAGIDPDGINPFEFGDTGGMDDPTLLPTCWEDCALACNNLVHVAVNQACEADLASDMILEGENEACAMLGFYEVIVRDENGNIIPNGSLDGNYVGRKLEVTVREIICGNSCWGYIIIEDKAPPVMNCFRDTFSCNVDLSPYNIGFPVSANSITPTGNPREFVATDIDACGEVELSYRDSVVSLDCLDPDFSSIIYRRWRAVDQGGYAAICFDTIYLERGTFADLTLPPHWDGTDNPPLNCLEKDIIWPTFPNGTPDTSYTGQPEGIFCGNIQFDFYDDTIAVCGPSFKVLRNWIILDWCDPGNKLFYTQRIKIEDTRPPVVIRPPIDTVYTDDHDCTTRAKVTPPTVIAECGDWTYRILYKPSDGSGNPDPAGATDRNVELDKDGFYYINDLPVGRSWIVYYLTDECGNTSECVTEIDVFDNVKPVPICHKHTTVSLTTEGTAKVPAQVLNDGSYDNCDIDGFFARRLQNGNCPPGVNDTTLFAPYLEFCCEDIDENPIRVEMRVYDNYGNFSNCKVEVNVQDKIPPFVECPPHLTVSCEFDLTDLSVFGEIKLSEDDREPITLNDPSNTDVKQPFTWGIDGFAIDNCVYEIFPSVIDNRNDCGTGELIRRFRVEDAGGLATTCSQIITVKDFFPLNRSDIDWPDDLEVFGCKEDTDPDETGTPVIMNQDACNLVAASYEDEVFNYVDGTCYKILRRWTVIDWCTFPNGYWEHTQVIKVMNNEAPQFTSDCTDRTICITGPSCNTDRITLTASAIDDCTPQDELLYRYEIDIDNDGDVEITGTGNQISRFFTGGVNRITWFVEDQCENVEECSYLIIVDDCKAPTPYCRTGIVTVLMPTTAEVTIWASDLDVNSSDNCTDQDDLKFSFSSDTTDNFMTYNCDDLEDGISDTITVQIWVTDEAGNQDFCTTTVVVQDNQDVCPDIGTTAMIAGQISHFANKDVAEVQVNIQNSNMQSPTYAMTSNRGEYAFNDLSAHEDYYVIPHKNDDPLNGVTTKDLVFIQRHILGIDEFDSPYELIAADINNSASISAKDLVELRKMILGINTEFPNNDSWRFVNEKYQFPDPRSPWNFEQEIAYLNISKNEMDANFVGIKVGDVNGSVESSYGQGTQSRYNPELPVFMSEKVATDAGYTQLAFSLQEELDIASMQFTLVFDPTVFTYEKINTGALDITEGMVNESLAREGIITLSWSDPNGIKLSEGQAMFYLAGNKMGSAMPNMAITSSVTTAEAYSLTEGDFDLKLILDNSLTSNGGFELYQNTPNPFTGETVIRYALPAMADVRISFFDLSGKVILYRELTGNAGINEMTITADQFSTQGVIYYRLETEGYTATKRMILINN